MGQAFIHFLSIQEKSGYRFHDNRLISFGGTCGGQTCDSLLKRRQSLVAICTQSLTIPHYSGLLPLSLLLSLVPIPTIELYPFLYPFLYPRSLSPYPLSQIKRAHKSPLGEVYSHTLRGSFRAGEENNGGSTPYFGRDLRNADPGKTECFSGMLDAA